jgi:hypothetical protein
MLSAGPRLAAGAIVATLGAMQGSCLSVPDDQDWTAAQASANDNAAALRGAQAPPDPVADAGTADLRTVAADLSVRLRGLQEADSPVLHAAEAEVRSLAERLDLIATALGTPTARFEPVWGVPDPVIAPADTTGSAFAPAPSVEGARSLMHAVRLASFADPAEAVAHWPAMVERHGALLAGLDPRLESVTLPGGGLRVELKVGPIASRDDAEVRCVALAQMGAECVVDDFSGRRLHEAITGGVAPVSAERVIG